MKNMLKVWLSRHLQVFFDTLGRLWQSRLSSAMTILVIAIAMALPMVLYSIANSIQAATSDWTETPQISLFLKIDDNIDPIAIGQRILQNPLVDDVAYFSPEQGLQQLSTLPGLSEAVEALPNNPLPAMLVITPASRLDQLTITQLVENLQQMPTVDTVIYDQQWLQRLDAIVTLIQNGVIILACLMIIGILLIVANTIRLAIINRASEIEIIDQVGGTHAFIRRPFLYAGGLQCLIGGLSAWILSNIALSLLSRPVAQLATLYESQFELYWMNPRLAIIAMTCAVLLGIITAAYTVNSYLRSLRPI